MLFLLPRHLSISLSSSCLSPSLFSAISCKHAFPPPLSSPPPVSRSLISSRFPPRYLLQYHVNMRFLLPRLLLHPLVGRNCTRVTIGGNTINYIGDCGTKTASLETVKLVVNINSTLSTPDAEYMTMDLSNFYLGTPLDRTYCTRWTLYRRTNIANKLARQNQQASTAEDARLDNRLTMDLSKLSRLPMVAISADADKCYDRINHIILSLVLREQCVASQGSSEQCSNLFSR